MREKEGEQQPGVGVLWNLPETWQWTAMGEISAVVGGGTPSTANEKNFGGDVPWITPADMSTHTGKYISAGGRYLSHQGMGVSGAQWLPKNTVLFSSRAPIGYCAIASQPVTTNQGFKSFIPMEGINSEYLYYWLTSAKRHAEALASGTTFLELSAKKAAQIPVPIAPVTEQTRIVEKLEELLADLDAGVAELKTAQKKLAQYRQSLLKAAVEGQLTADWRAQHPPTETGAELLSRILEERRTRWEAKQREKFASQGKTPPQNWQSKYPEPVAPDTQNLPKLPEGWVWASLDQLVAESSYGTSTKCSYESTGIPVLRIPNIGQGQVDLRDMKFSVTELNLDKDDFLAIGDILVIRTNGSIGLVGRAAAVISELSPPHYFASYLLRLRCVETTCAHRWILTVLSAHAGRQWLEERAASSAGQHNISLSTLLTMPIPFPPAAEQFHALGQVEEGEHLVQQQQESLAHALKQSTAQRQNILRAAFAGELVPQNPNDEPASVLLARIRAQRATQTPAKKPRGRKKKEAL